MMFSANLHDLVSSLAVSGMLAVQNIVNNKIKKCHVLKDGSKAYWTKGGSLIVSPDGDPVYYLGYNGVCFRGTASFTGMTVEVLCDGTQPPDDWVMSAVDMSSAISSRAIQDESSIPDFRKFASIAEDQLAKVLEREKKGNKWQTC